MKENTNQFSGVSYVIKKEILESKYLKSRGGFNLHFALRALEHHELEELRKDLYFHLGEVNDLLNDLLLEKGDQNDN